MAITFSTVKRLFAKSRNKCAMPNCKAVMVSDHNVIGEICHIRARNKRGPRFDPNLSPNDKDDFPNLLLMCPTCHTLADKDRKAFTVELLTEIKEIHEREGQIELTPIIASQAQRLFEKVSIRNAGNQPVHSSHGAVAVSIGGNNHGPIRISVSNQRGAKGKGPLPGSIGADANMCNYIDYLCDLYVKYMQPIETDQGALWARIGKHIKTRFQLRKRNRNDLSAERFSELINYLVEEKLANTPVGKKNLRNGIKLCRTFAEYRHGEM